MLQSGTRVEIDPENPMSIRVVGGRAMDGKTLVLQLNGDQECDQERTTDARIVVEAINKYLLLP